MNKPLICMAILGAYWVLKTARWWAARAAYTWNNANLETSYSQDQWVGTGYVADILPLWCLMVWAMYEVLK